MGAGALVLKGVAAASSGLQISFRGVRGRMRAFGGTLVLGSVRASEEFSASCWHLLRPKPLPHPGPSNPRCCQLPLPQ